MNKRAFTLAETLITLAIIGVIVALTVPTLMSKYQDYSNYVALKKFHAELTNADKMIIREFGDYAQSDDNQQELFGERLEQYLKITKKCVGTTGCWSGITKNLTGKINAYSAKENGFMEGYGKIISYILHDGSAITIGQQGWINRHGCGEEPAYLKPSGRGYVLVVDVNGKKGPNRMGKDVFPYILTKTGFCPGGLSHYKNNSYLNLCSMNPKTDDVWYPDNFTGWLCTAPVLYKPDFWKTLR